MKYTYVVWDFNGTILDDVAIGIESVNTLLKRRGIEQIKSVEAYREVFCFPIIRYYEKIGFDFALEDFSVVAVEWVDEYMSRVSGAKAHSGVLELITKLKKNGVKNILVSATEENMLKKQISMLGIADLFDGVYGLDNIHAVNKIAIAKNWRETAPDAQGLFVGDTDHDVETAQAINAECVLFAGGHQSSVALGKLGCRVVENFAKLDALLF